ncbi:MAG: rhodanese-related sulfurtransferase [Bacteroidetes bacterium]|nr:rhodanese-related sulfurtransferase [Bacteroidota bacterium]
MKKLHNTIDKRILRQRMLEENVERTTISFYKYHSISEPQLFRDALYAAWSELGVLGRTYIASEGINAQISIPSSQFNTFVEQLYAIPFLNGVRLNTAVEHGKSFFALKVKVRNKIVADGIDDPTFDPSNTGKYLTAEEWNEKMSDPNTVVVDMRNHYESEVGHFQGALMPDVDTFREELRVVEEILEKDKDKNVLMYCTGGIRCEKATAFMKHKGFDNVYHLEGGIIKYARDIKANHLENKFRGVNFVFDERLAERVSEEIIARCHQCGDPFDLHTNCVNLACHILFIQCPKCKEQFENCCSDTCREITHLPIEEQRKIRKDKPVNRNVFKKGRFPIQEVNTNISE